MFTILSTDTVFLFDNCTNLRKVLIDLVVKLGSVRYDKKSKVPGQFPQNLLREEHHRIAFAASLCVPENTEAFVSLTLNPSPIGRGKYADRGRDDLQGLLWIVENDRVWDTNNVKSEFAKVRISLGIVYLRITSFMNR